MGAEEIKIFVTPNTVLYTGRRGIRSHHHFRLPFPFCHRGFSSLLLPTNWGRREDPKCFLGKGDHLLFGGGGGIGGGGATPTPCFANWLVSPEKKRGEESFFVGGGVVLRCCRLHSNHEGFRMTFLPALFIMF